MLLTYLWYGAPLAYHESASEAVRAHLTGGSCIHASSHGFTPQGAGRRRAIQHLGKGVWEDRHVDGQLEGQPLQGESMMGPGLQPYGLDRHRALDHL